MNMGNQRQMLKQKIEKELASKIEASQDTLEQLNKNLEISNLNSLKVQDEINDNFEMLRQILNYRKKELIKQVENLHRAQVRPLQEAIKSTYVTMGRLQSMLANIDSFDQGQLVNLQIPAVDTSFLLTDPIEIGATLDSSGIKRELNEFGTVTGDADGFQCFMMGDFEEDLNRSVRSMCEKMTTMGVPTATNSSTSELRVVSSQANKENQEPSAKPTEMGPICGWGIENWLKRAPLAKPSSVASKEDFLIVPTSTSYEDIECISECDLQEDGESGSSILCLEKNQSTVQSQEDLSMWLKPKKTKSQSHSNNEASSSFLSEKSAVLSNSDNIVQKNCGPAGNTEKGKRILEFPCLSMNADIWIRKKKSKPGSSSSTLKSNNSFRVVEEQHKLIPPAYALPNPFWLKTNRR